MHARPDEAQPFAHTRKAATANPAAGDASINRRVKANAVILDCDAQQAIITNEFDSDRASLCIAGGVGQRLLDTTEDSGFNFFGQV